MTKRDYCSDEYPPHDPGGCPNCRPAPRVVAECRTCCGCERGLPCTNEYRSVKLDARGAAGCRSLDHDVRSVEVKP